MERISAEEALNLVLDKVYPKQKSENAPINEALGRVCASTVYAAIDNPPFDRSPFDGFALRSSDSAGATPENPARLRVAGTVYAGDVYTERPGRGTAVRIMTGAMFPPDYDCMVMQENVRVENGGAEILVSGPVGAYENYVHAGEDIRKGQLLIEAG